MSQPPKPKSTISTMLVPFVVFMLVMILFPNQEKKPQETDSDNAVTEKSTNKDNGMVSDTLSENTNKSGSESVQKDPVKLETDTVPKMVDNKLVLSSINLKHSDFKFSSKGACITSVHLKENHDAGIHGKGIDLLTVSKSKYPHFSLSIGDDKELYTRNWEVFSETKNKKIVYKLTTSTGIKATKTFEINSDYQMLLSVDIELDSPSEDNVVLYGATGIMLESDDMMARQQSFGYFIGQRTNGSSFKNNNMFSDLESTKVLSTSEDNGVGQAKLLWVGLRNKYFTILAKPPEGTKAFLEYVPGIKNEDGEINPNGLMAVNKSFGKSNKFSLTMPIYIGPLQEDSLKATNLADKMELALEQDNFMSSSTIENLLLSVLKVIYNFVGSYGFAIIILTICVRACIHPLTRYSQTRMQESSEKMAILQPKIEALKKKYAKDPKVLQKEQMKLFAENNAMGGMMLGCLPMLLQFPIYIALYSMIRSFIEFRGNAFGPIDDLSLPDSLISLPFTLPLVGNSLNILPFMTLTVTVISMKRGMKRNNANKKLTPEQQAQQKMMTFMMPPFLLFITYGFSSGLLLYWFTSGLIGTLEAEYIRNKREKLKLKKKSSLKPALK